MKKKKPLFTVLNANVSKKELWDKDGVIIFMDVEVDGQKEDFWLWYEDGEKDPVMPVRDWVDRYKVQLRIDIIGKKFLRIFSVSGLDEMEINEDVIEKYNHWANG